MQAAACAEGMEGPSVGWMKDMAGTARATICGSLIIEEDGQYFNRFIAAAADGSLHQYDKRHLFRLAGEHEHFSPGSNVMTFTVNDFAICPMICYDLRFPVWSRNRNNYDMLLYVANWPSRRHLAWETLLRARAIENLSFAAGVNRCGIDGNELPHAGGSAIVDYLGADLANLGDQVGVSSVTLDKDSLLKYRDRFAFHQDADKFDIRK
jgi:predicted amidohydrolase